MPPKRKASKASGPPPSKTKRKASNASGPSPSKTKRKASNTSRPPPSKIKRKASNALEPSPSKTKEKASNASRPSPSKTKRKASNVSGPSPSKIKLTKTKEAVEDTSETPLKKNSDTGITSFLMDDSWRAVLESEFQKPYFKVLENKLDLEYKQGKTIFPPKDLIFNALNLTPLDKVKVVILGQDPYHDDDQAMGLSFSVPNGIKVPPSLKNMYKELDRDPEISGFKEPDHGCLEKWAKDGVLLLNATLTVEAHKPNSHASFGWQEFTDHVIKTVSDCGSPAVFILWGGFAHKKEKLIDKSKHKVIKTAHPSPLSFNKFKGCGCFSECNKSLKEIGQIPVDWSL